MSSKYFDIVLISPSSRIMNHYRPPLALMYLSGYLKKHSVKTKIIDVTIKQQVRDKAYSENKNSYLLEAENETISEVGSVNTDIVGITCYTPEVDEVERIVSRIKSVKPNIKIIVGGIHPTLYPDDFLGSDSLFDFVVIGEGEVTLLELVKAIKSENENYGNVKGIGFFNRDTKKNVITAKQPLVGNLDEISFPDYEDLDMGFYTTASPYAIRGVFSRSFYISSSRGCPSSCTFCVSKKLRKYHGIEKFVRLRSPLSLYNEIQELKNRFKIDSFYFIDDLFTLKKGNVHKFCNLMIKNKSPLIWGCSSKVNTVNYEMLKAMRNAGCVQIDFGVEKGSDQALKSLKKGITVRQIKNTFQCCHDLCIRTFANMLVNTPGETEDDLNDIINLVREIKPSIVSFNIFAPYPGCEIYDSFCENLGQKDYLLLMNTGLLLDSMADKFRFAAHDTDLLKWVEESGKKFNRILPNITIYFKLKYLHHIMLSKRKSDYARQLKFLFKEFIVQKF